MTPNYDEELKAQELKLSLYQVAEIQETGTYTVTTSFQSMNDSIADISDRTTAADWTAMAEAAEAIVEEIPVSPVHQRQRMRALRVRQSRIWISVFIS